MAWREAALDPEPEGEGRAGGPCVGSQSPEGVLGAQGSTPQASSQPLEGPTEDVVTDHFQSLNHL